MGTGLTEAAQAEMQGVGMLSVCREFTALWNQHATYLSGGPMQQSQFFVSAVSENWWDLSSHSNQ